MFRGRGRFFRRRGNLRRAVQARVRPLRHELQGRQVGRLRADPPSIVLSPWNTVTLAFRVTEDTAFTLATIVTQLIIQTGLSSASGWLFRFKSVRAWEVAGNDLALTTYSLDDNHASNTFSDVVGRNRWAHLGYEWPLDMQNNVFKSTGTQSLFDVKTNKGTATTERIVVHVNMLYRSGGGQTLPEAWLPNLDALSLV